MQLEDGVTSISFCNEDQNDTDIYRCSECESTEFILVDIDRCDRANCFCHRLGICNYCNKPIDLKVVPSDMYQPEGSTKPNKTSMEIFIRLPKQELNYNLCQRHGKT